jgi:putative transposase
VLSTGEVIANPRHLEVAQRELRRLQRQAARRTGPDKRTRQPSSRRWVKTQARITHLHSAVANARRDGLHKLSTRLVRRFGAVVVEDLNVAGMTSNRRLARRIAGLGMAELRRQIEYKATWSGVCVYIADRWYPSSKTCSDCGAVKAKLRLSERTYTCDQCGLTLDRDLNAARNLAALISEATGDEGGELRRNSPMETHVRPAPRGHRVPPREDPQGQRPHRKERAQDTVLHVS